MHSRHSLQEKAKLTYEKNANMAIETAKAKMIGKLDAKPSLSDPDLINTFEIIKKSRLDWVR